MLKLLLPEIECYDNKIEEFVILPEKQILLEHSLYSLSKWEQTYEKPFLSKETKTREEMLYYIYCMRVDDTDDDTFWLQRLSSKDIAQIEAYLSAKMTATTINDLSSNKRGPLITSEVLYARMAILGIPFECQHWHLNRLLTLIRVCIIETSPPKKMSNRAILNQNRDINLQRLKKYNTTG